MTDPLKSRTVQTRLAMRALGGSWVRAAALSAFAAVWLGGPALTAQSGIPLGTWEYRQRNVAHPSGVDAEGERLVIARAGGEIVITYFGLEREGEHGLYYTAVAAKNVPRTDDGPFEFIVPARRLYRIRPRSLAQAARLESAGVINEPLRMTAVTRGDVLTVTCASDDGSCPEPVMTFRRVPGSK